ncbi:MAG: NAD(P)/FAD-dependent oxidoreductase [Lachnospiraceae bacterium]|nr:NAD(P)/FAD-dependent oxidoreductase [Lachnospiraceae bacterium]
MAKVIIAGGGASGMFAAIIAAQQGHEVELFEKNEKLGKKLFITGKGRCNLTNACDMEELFDSVCTNAKFLYSAFYGFTNQDTIQFFEDAGLHTKTERGNRVFPCSDHSSDVIQVLDKKMRQSGVKVHLNTKVKNLLLQEDQCIGICLDDGKKIFGDKVIVATGGLSYPSTGSTGDGYEFAKACGHKVTELMPSLVPFNASEKWVKELQGLSLKNVSIRIFDGKKKLYEDFGEMMFTHFGVTGPVILSASGRIGKKLRQKELKMEIDLKPALSEEQLDKRLVREFEEAQNRQFKNVLGSLFPAKLIPVMVELSEILPEKRVNEISREERQNFLHKIKHLELTLTGLRDYNEAIITKGGIQVKEINPSTMESKLVHGLYFIGEVLDLDAVTGGFNLQIAWSTAYAAAANLSE